MGLLRKVTIEAVQRSKRVEGLQETAGDGGGGGGGR